MNDNGNKVELVAGDKSLVKMRVTHDIVTVERPDGSRFMAKKDEVIEVDPEVAKSLEVPISYPYSHEGELSQRKPPKVIRAVRI